MTDEVIIPFGQHRGKTMEEVPDSYLQYILDDWDNEELLLAAESEQMNRKKYGIKVF